MPKEPIRAGSEHVFRLSADLGGRRRRTPPNTGRVVATRIGLGGWPGQPRPADQRKFVVDFTGGALDALTRSDKVQPVVTASRGRIVKASCFQVRGTKEWRAFIDLELAGDDPIELRLHLTHDGTAITETWLYEFLCAADAVGEALRSRPIDPP